MKKSKGISKGFLVIIILGLLAVNILDHLGFGGLSLRFFGQKTQETVLLQNGDEQMPATANQIQIEIKENQIYFNSELVQFEQLKEKLTQLKEKQRQIKLVDNKAKRVIYQQVEDLLQGNGLIIIKVSKPEK